MRLRFLLVAFVASLSGLAPATTIASAAIPAYDVPPIARVGAQQIEVVAADPIVLSNTREGSAPPQARARGRLTTPNPGSVATNNVDEVFHYTRGEFVDSISANGLRPGSYATPNGSLSPLQAQIDLALPPNTGLRDAVLRVDVAGLRQAGYEIPSISRVSNTVTGPGGRAYTMPGGGYEMQFPYAIPPEFIKVVTP